MVCTWNHSAELFDRSQHSLAGGVSSSVRAGDKPFPMFFKRGAGSRIFDVDGNEYIDYVLARGPLILGHSHPVVIQAVKEQLDLGQIYAGQHELEVELSEKLCRLIPCAELVRYNSSGSEAVHAALRLARAFTGRNKIVKFEGHYHGWFDNILFGLDTHPPKGQSESTPITGESAGQESYDSAGLLLLPWNDIEAFERAVERSNREIAAVIMEPVMCNHNVDMPSEGYLASVRDICSRNGLVLIFDEVVTGFRVALGGAQSHFGVTPDLAVFGKAMASGFPLSCLVGRRDMMKLIADGTVIQGGTFNSNPVVLAAAVKTLEILGENNGTIFEQIHRRGERLMEGISRKAYDNNIRVVVQGLGSVFSLRLVHVSAEDRASTPIVDNEQYDRFVIAMMERGIRLIPRGSWLLSSAHSDQDIDLTVEVVGESFQKIYRESGAADSGESVHSAGFQGHPS